MKPALRLLVVPLSAVTLAGCGGSGHAGGSPRALTATASAENPGCAPQCLSGGSDPGTLPPGQHRTSYFFNGQLTVTFTRRWESHEDQPVEFSVAPEGSWDLHRVLFWSDLIPVNKDHKRLGAVARDASALVARLRTRPNLEVSAPRRGATSRDSSRRGAPHSQRRRPRQPGAHLMSSAA